MGEVITSKVHFYSIISMAIFGNLHISIIISFLLFRKKIKRIGSMYGKQMLTKLGYISMVNVTICGIHTDPSWVISNLDRMVN